MENIRAKIGGNDVVCSGVLVLYQGQHAEILPLKTDPQFCLRFEFDFTNEFGVDKLSVDSTSDKTTVFKFTRSFNIEGGFSPSEPIIFAVEDDESIDYYISFALSRWGGREKNTTVLNYTVTQTVHGEGF